MTTGIILVAALLLAYANGANDNFKGVATLFGSGTTKYRRALLWATATTLIGSLTAMGLAQQMLGRFQGRGLVPDELAAEPRFLAAVGLAAGLTVLMATRAGMPVSTTHALVGALLGVGAASAAPLRWDGLTSNFIIPLFLSPVVAMVGTATVYPLLRHGRVRLGITKETCLCVGTEVVEVVPAGILAVALERAQLLTLTVASPVTCRERYGGRLLGVDAARVLDGLHHFSSGLVSFARGLNDTPKIAALLLATPWLSPSGALAMCAAAIALGGVLSTRRVGETMSYRITPMNAGQGFTANLLTGLLVVAASCWGLPVSTTHVSCGSLFGLGAVTGRADRRSIASIALAWLLTLPAAAVLGWACRHVIVWLA